MNSKISESNMTYILSRHYGQGFWLTLSTFLLNYDFDLSFENLEVSECLFYQNKMSFCMKDVWDIGFSLINAHIVSAEFRENEFYRTKKIGKKKDGVMEYEIVKKIRDGLTSQVTFHFCEFHQNKMIDSHGQITYEKIALLEVHFRSATVEFQHSIFEDEFSYLFDWHYNHSDFVGIENGVRGVRKHVKKISTLNK